MCKCCEFVNEIREVDHDTVYIISHGEDFGDMSHPMFIERCKTVHVLTGEVVYDEYYINACDGNGGLSELIIACPMCGNLL